MFISESHYSYDRTSCPAKQCTRLNQQILCVHCKLQIAIKVKPEKLSTNKLLLYGWFPKACTRLFHRHGDQPERGIRVELSVPLVKCSLIRGASCPKQEIKVCVLCSSSIFIVILHCFYLNKYI
jgi:hypothetical protein